MISEANEIETRIKERIQERIRELQHDYIFYTQEFHKTKNTDERHEFLAMMSTKAYVIKTLKELLQ